LRLRFRPKRQIDSAQKSTLDWYGAYYSWGIIFRPKCFKPSDNIACRCDDCKPYWSRVEITTWFLFFFPLIFVQIHRYGFIQLLYKLCTTNSFTVWCLYQFVHFLCDFCTNSYIFYTNCIVPIHTTIFTACCAGSAGRVYSSTWLTLFGSLT
jgi:hypothetical protein